MEIKICALIDEIKNVSSEEEYNILKEKFKQTGLSLYSLHKLIEKKKDSKKTYKNRGGFIIINEVSDCRNCEKRNSLNVLLETNIASLTGKTDKLRRINWLVGILVFVIIVLFLEKEEITRDLENTIRQQRDTIMMQNTSVSVLQASIQKMTQEKEQMQTKLTEIGNIIPIVIIDLKVANVYTDGSIETDFGKTIYSKNSMFLTPKIFYKITRNEKIRLYVKLYRENILYTGKFNNENGEKINSPLGYSYYKEIEIDGNEVYELIGWGKETKGFWSSGKYCYEIWYNERILYKKDFTIY